MNQQVMVSRYRELFDLDAATGDLRWKSKAGPSSRAKVGSVAGRKNGDGYWHISVDGKVVKAHRIVFAIANGYLPREVDHINGVRADNRPENLREATRHQNNRNTRTRCDNTSGVKGVSWSKNHGKWWAQVMVNKRQIHIGYFTDLAEAAVAVRAHRQNLHGEFARHE